MINVLVMGSGGTAGINFIDSLLSAGGYRIIGCDMNKWHLKLIEKRFSIQTYQSPHCSDEYYIEFINNIITKHKIDFVHAQPDIEVEILANNREKLKSATFFPSNETIQKCRDKYITSQLLEGMCPLSCKVNEKNIEKQLKIIQHSSSEKVWLRAVRGAGSKAALPITTSRQALDWINYWKETKRMETEDFMISEFLPGKEFAFQSIWYKGNIITSMARERIEYFMGNLFPSGQSSSPSVARTICDERVNEIATKAIRTIDSNATGVFCVDMKENIFGIPCVTEINAGRFFTTSNFFSSFGSNMPDIYVKLGMIESLPKYNSIPENITWVRGADTLPYGYMESKDVL